MVSEDEILRDRLVSQLYDCIARVKSLTLEVQSSNFDFDVTSSSLKFATANLRGAIRKIEIISL